MEALIILLLIVYMYLLIHFGLKESTKITSVSFCGLMRLETLLIILPLLVSMGFSFAYWGVLAGPHNGALLFVFVIIPTAILVVIAEVIIFGIVRDVITGIKALFLAVVIIFYLWFTSKYGG